MNETQTPLQFYIKMQKIADLDVIGENEKILCMAHFMADTLWDLGYCSGVDIFDGKLKSYCSKPILLIFEKENAIMEENKTILTPKDFKERMSNVLTDKMFEENPLATLHSGIELITYVLEQEGYDEGVDIFKDAINQHRDDLLLYFALYREEKH